jgi:preprotein translocase SecE subunit
MVEKIKNYLKESFLELKKVKWLTKEETINLTLEVVIFSLIFVIVYGIFDALLVRILFLLK